MLGPCRDNFAVNATALLIVLVFISANAGATDQVTAGPPDLSTIISRLTQAQFENLSYKKPYSLTREYKIFGAEAVEPRTSVVARVNFLPPNVKSYDIDESTGGMGEKVIRHILDHEVDATRDPQQMMVNDENYTFAFAGEGAVDGHSCYKLNIKPKQQRKELMKATIWIDQDSYRIMRMDGEPAKSPSFWVKEVHIVLEFGEVAGMWLQTDAQAMARLRFGGEYRIVSQNLNYDVARTVGVNTRPANLRRSRASAMIATSVR